MPDLLKSCHDKFIKKPGTMAELIQKNNNSVATAIAKLGETGPSIAWLRLRLGEFPERFIVLRRRLLDNF